MNELNSACLKSVFFFFQGGNDKCFQAAFGESRTPPGSREIKGGKQTIKEKLLISETKRQYLVLITAAISETACERNYPTNFKSAGLVKILIQFINKITNRFSLL